MMSQEMISINTMANIFLKNQIVKMPAYKNVLSENEINYLISYIEWLRKENF